MTKLFNKRLAVVTAIAGLGIGAAATPALSLAASHPGTTTVVRADPRSPDRPGTKDGARRDTKADKTSSIDRPSVDKTSVDKPSVDPATNR
ncbi:MAG: hypothetical protein WBQ18_04170 [Solirubrobacteraceae bacterium]